MPTVKAANIQPQRPASRTPDENQQKGQILAKAAMSGAK